MFWCSGFLYPWTSENYTYVTFVLDIFKLGHLFYSIFYIPTANLIPLLHDLYSMIRLKKKVVLSYNLRISLFCTDYCRLYRSTTFRVRHLVFAFFPIHSEEIKEQLFDVLRFDWNVVLSEQNKGLWTKRDLSL